MFFAAENNSHDVVRFFLENGFDIHSTDKRGQTLLHWACMNGDAKLIEIIMEHLKHIEDVRGRIPNRKIPSPKPSPPKPMLKEKTCSIKKFNTQQP